MLIALKKYLEDRKLQLESRVISINYYLNHKKEFKGGKQFTEQDLILTKESIKETKAALAGIEQWKKGDLKIE